MKGLHVVEYISKPDVVDYVWCGVVWCEQGCIRPFFVGHGMRL